MKRRTFISAGLALLAASVSAWFILNFKKTVRKILHADTGNLRIDPKAVDRFIADADKELFWREFSLAKKIFTSIQHVAHTAGIHLPYHAKYLHYRNKITGQFLFSTDLFQPPFSPNKIIRYTSFHNPYKIPCANPFSNLRAEGQKKEVEAEMKLGA